MPRYDFRTPRLHIQAPLGPGTKLALADAQAHYLRNVLRLKEGDSVLLFNGRDGEWRGSIAGNGRRRLGVAVSECTRAQTAPADLHYLFAPLKHARLDYLVQKAVEMGVSRLQPLITRHTQASRVSIERMRANAIEAAEQCGILTLAEVAAPLPLAAMLAGREPDRLIVFCDEQAEVSDPVAALAAARREGAPPPLAVLVGPEGGFAAEERASLLAVQNAIRLPLGPRILRADTAAVAALALVQAVLGDWR